MIEHGGALSESACIQVSYVGELRDVIGDGRETLSVRRGTSVWEFLLDLARTHVGLRSLLDDGKGIDRGELVVFRNGLNIAHANHRQAQLTDGDKFVFTKPLGGG